MSDPLQQSWAPRWLSWERIRLQCWRSGFNPWVGKIPWRRERLPTPVSWPGESHELYSPQGRKESDMTERLSVFATTESSTVQFLSEETGQDSVEGPGDSKHQNHSEEQLVIPSITSGGKRKGVALQTVDSRGAAGSWGFCTVNIAWLHHGIFQGPG